MRRTDEADAMKDFLVWLARYHLRAKYSGLWGINCMLWAFSYRYIGNWMFLWLPLSAIPITILEVWWNDYADDYSDLRGVGGDEANRNSN